MKVMAGMLLPTRDVGAATLLQYDVLVADLPMIRWWRSNLARATFDGKKIIVHAPACYGRPGEYQGDFYDEWYALASAAGAGPGWLVDDAGRQVKNGNDILFDMRNASIATAMGEALVRWARTCAVHGYFLDCVWESVTWTTELGYFWKDRKEVDAAWTIGMRAFLLAVRKSGKFICANGWWGGVEADAMCYEDTPGASCIPALSGNWYGLVTSAGWGLAWHAQTHESGAWLIPHTQAGTSGGPGWGILPERVAIDVAMARTYAPRMTTLRNPARHTPWHPVVFDNQGAVVNLRSIT